MAKDTQAVTKKTEVVIGSTFTKKQQGVRIYLVKCHWSLTRAIARGTLLKHWAQIAYIYRVQSRSD